VAALNRCTLADHLAGTRFDLALGPDAGVDYTGTAPVLYLDPVRTVVGSGAGGRVRVPGVLSAGGAVATFTIPAPAAALTPGAWAGGVIFDPDGVGTGDWVLVDLAVTTFPRGPV